MTANELHPGYMSMCSENEENIVKSYQVRPYYEGSEHLEVLWVCTECGRYALEDFKKEKPK